ncbi:uncharacterized protein BDV14DRAFT_95507 [Aspergillus stella-maris]|uniref:uncharacterized protein n=1 Tax=Aspergillus stella-maris TaxID=1810926 RepID=UPI003CCE40AB
MIRPFLSLTAVFLGALTVSAEDPDIYTLFPRSTISKPYTLNLPVAGCAFTYTECVENIPPSSISVTFSTENDTLLANKEIIFPAYMPMEFSAERKSDLTPESIHVAYAIDVQPLPHQPDTMLSDLYRLTITLMDLQGRIATKSPVSIGMLRDNEGNLQIIQVEESSYQRFHHHLPQAEETEKGGSWWEVKQWRSLYLDLLREKSYSWDCPSDRHSAYANDRVECSHHHHQTPSDWGRDRHYMKHLRPVLVPAMMGMAAGVVACVLGFIIGKIIVAVYCLLHERERGEEDYERGVEDVSFSSWAEKQRLMARDNYAPCE